jgi:hypothetical protein
VADPLAIERFTALYDEYYRRVCAYVVSGRAASWPTRRSARYSSSSGGAFPTSRRTRCHGCLPSPATSYPDQFRATARQQSLAAELQSWTTPYELAEGDIAKGNRVAATTWIAPPGGVRLHRAPDRRFTWSCESSSA